MKIFPRIPKASLPGLAMVLFLLLLWEFSARAGAVNIQALSYPSEILGTLLRLASTSTFYVDIGQSALRVLVGFLLGSLAGATIGLASALSKSFYTTIRLLLDGLRPIPPIAWIPIAIVWFGLGNRPAYFLVGLGTFFPVFTSMFDAVGRIERNLVNVARSLGASNRMLLHSVIAPLVLPELLTGLRIGLGIGWMIVITAEMVGAQSGLGYRIQISRVLLETPEILVGMGTIALVGAALNRLMLRCERWLVPWKARAETVAGRGLRGS